MRYFELVNQGLEEVAKQEIKEKLNVDAIVNKNILEFETKKDVNLQSARRILTAITKTKDLSKINLRDFPKDFFTNETKFKIEVENVKGQEDRLDISRDLATKFFDLLKPTKPVLELKKPNFLIIVYFNEENYFIGIDKNVKEINARSYRVFPHSASFKGDLAYYFVRKSLFKPKEKLLSGFCKDGAIAIEAAKYSNDIIYAFDEAMPNVTAARKNAKIAKVELKIQKYAFDDLDVKYDQDFFDRIIFHVTSKDEVKINEIYYQASYILKSKGTLLIIGRSQCDLSISDKFKLLEENQIIKGESVYKFWLLEKK
jgi:23S rRNA G2445 N2-methylase RlmL